MRLPETDIAITIGPAGAERAITQQTSCVPRTVRAAADVLMETALFE